VATRSVKSRFGSRLRQLRDERGYSQEELAERAGLPRNYVGGVEGGEQNVALENIVKLAKALSAKPAICSPNSLDGLQAHFPRTDSVLVPQTAAYPSQLQAATAPATFE
jgi:transcriptional regulator with XRE-family HTH domain